MLVQCLRLPSRISPSGSRGWPLLPATSRRLARVLVQDDAQLQARLLDELLARDPWLLTWMVLHDERWRAAPPAERTELAEAARHLPKWLDHNPEAYLPPCEVPAAWAVWAVHESQPPPGRALRTDLAIGLTTLQLSVGAGGGAPYAGGPIWLSPGSSFWADGGSAEEERSAAACYRAWDQAAQAKLLPDAAEISAPEQAPTAESELALEAAFLADLVRHCRHPASREADVEAQLEAAKRQALIHFAYGASHEINNPLTNIATRAQALLLDERDPERRRKLSIIHAQAFRAFEMIADVMLFAKPPALRPAFEEVPQLVSRVVREVTAEAQAQRTELRWQPADSWQGWLDAEQVAVALRSLLRNSLEALGQGGWIKVEAQRNGTGANSAFELSVQDNGPGIPEKLLPHIFDPYFSGREAGRGLGLGLSKCWRVVTAHGGDVRVHAPPTGGVAFTLGFPGR